VARHALGDQVDDLPLPGSQPAHLAPARDRPGHLGRGLTG